MTTLIFTIGTQDVSISRSVLEAKFPPTAVNLWGKDNRKGNFALFPRPGGKRLFDAFNTFAHDISLPIIEPALENTADTLQGEKPRIILVATDQDHTKIPTPFYNNDSIWFAKIVARMISVKYKPLYNKELIETISVHKEVAYLDKQYQFWTHRLTQAPFSNIDPQESVYLYTQGGIPTINTALMFTVLQKFGEQVTVVNINESTHRAFSTNFSAQYIIEKEKEKARNYLKRFEYYAFSELRVSEEIKALADYMYHRLNFDFKAAEKALDGVKDNITFSDAEIINVRKRIQEVEEGNSLLLLQELIENAYIKYQQEAYVDFLLRFFRIIEELTKNEAMAYLGNFQFEANKWAETFLPYLSAPKNQPLKDFLDQYTFKGRPIKYDGLNPSIPLYIAIIEHYQDQEFLDFVAKVDGLRNMRNLSIGAHAFHPVSRSKIDGELWKHNLSVDDLFNYLRKATGITSWNFERINQEIERLLEEQD